MHMFLNICWSLNCHNKFDTYDAWSVWVELVCFELKFSFFFLQNLTHQPMIPSIFCMDSFFSSKHCPKILYTITKIVMVILWAEIYGISNCYFSNKKSRMRLIGNKNKKFPKLNHCRMWANCLVEKKSLIVLIWSPIIDYRSIY